MKTASACKAAQVSSQPKRLMRADKSLARYEDNTTFKVVVGEREASFTIHKQFVCKVSPFFQGA
jgi:hypothetical protein